MIDSVLQAPNGTEAENGPGIISVTGFERGENPKLSRRVPEGDTGGGNTNDFASDAVQKDLLAERVGIAAEGLLPARGVPLMHDARFATIIADRAPWIIVR
jgi:hypothetical protein